MKFAVITATALIFSNSLVLAQRASTGSTTTIGRKTVSRDRKSKPSNTPAETVQFRSKKVSTVAPGLEPRTR